MRRYLPICLDIAAKPVVVIGGGAVATERVDDLLACGADVTVIAPEVSASLEELAVAGRIVLRRRAYVAGDLAGAFLAVVAADDPATNAAAFAEAEAAGVLVNVCDDPEHCRFIFPAKIDRGRLTLAIFTHGTSPALSRRVRRELAAAIGGEYGELAELLAAIRPAVRAAPGLTADDRRRIYERLVYSEILLLLREGDRAAALARARELLAEALPHSVAAVVVAALPDA